MAVLRGVRVGLMPRLRRWRAWVAALALTAMLALALPAQGQDSQWTRSTGSFVIQCNTGDSTPQRCDPPRKLNVRVARGTLKVVRRLRYVAASTHCSSARVLVNLNGKRIGRTDWVEAGESSTRDDLQATLKHKRGGHRFKFRVQGRTGGCNAGVVGSWGGEIQLSGRLEKSP